MKEDDLIEREREKKEEKRNRAHFHNFKSHPNGQKKNNNGKINRLIIARIVTFNSN